MKILIVHYNFDNHNPSVRLWPNIFRYMGNTVFFGPGFVDERTLKGGLNSFIKNHGPFDIAVISEHFLFNSLPELPLEYQMKSYTLGYWFPFDIVSSLKKNRAILDEFLGLSCPKCVVMFEFDCYNMRDSAFQLITSIKIPIIGWGKQFVRPLRELKNADRESFTSHANDRWFDFVNDNESLIISVPAFLSEDEFAWHPLEQRRFSWFVPGTGYWARKSVKTALVDKGVRLPSRGFSIFVSILDYLRLRPFSRPVVMNLFNHFFREGIKKSRYCFTCGSGLQFPIRKFFEIPALGAVLVCEPCNGFSELGFRDRVNSLACRAEDIMEIDEFLSKNVEEAQEIAEKGRELMWKTHTTWARSRQILICFELLIEKTFVGSSWEGGVFRALGKNPDGVSFKRT